MSAFDPLATLDTWKAIPDPERTAILTALAHACGAPWRAGEVRSGLGTAGERAGSDRRASLTERGTLRGCDSRG